MDFIDKFNKLIGKAVAYLTIFMLIGTLYNVIARYFFSQYSTGLSEAVIIANAAMFLLISPLLLAQEKHVRVDIFYANMPPRLQATVDFLGTLFCLLPFCGFLLYFSYPYVLASWQQKEASSQTGGLPGLYLVKGLMLLFAFLLMLQGLSILCQKFAVIIGKKVEKPHTIEPPIT